MKPSELQKKEFRRSIDEIHPFGYQCWSEIEPLLYLKELDKNDFFSKVGDATRDLGFISSGILRIYYLDEKGREWNKHFLQENDFVASSISPDKNSITNIQALTKSTILCISYFELKRLASKCNEINLFIQKLTFSYLEQKQFREIGLLSEEAMNNYLAFRKIYAKLEDEIPHYHIASYLGITPTQLSRLRKKIGTHQHM